MRGFLAPVVLAAISLTLSACGSGSSGTTSSPTRDPVDVIADAGPADFADNLQARVDSGDWTLEDGLIASLELLLGRTAPANIFDDAEPRSLEANGLFAAAAEYVEAGEDNQAKNEIAELLDLLTPTQEGLDRVSRPENAVTAESVYWVLSNPISLPASERSRMTVPWGCGENLPPGLENEPELQDGNCMLVRELGAQGQRIGIYWPDMWFTRLQYNPYPSLAAEGVIDAANAFISLGPVKPVNVVFFPLPPETIGVSEDAAMAAHGPAEGEPCTIVVFPLAPPNSTSFKFDIAHEMFHCFQYWNVSDVNHNYEPRSWWIEGSADYFANVVYPNSNTEWNEHFLWAEPLSYNPPITYRKYENSVLFQHWANSIGNRGLIAVLDSLPTSGGRDRQEQALSALPGMAAFFHDFAEKLLTGGIVDTSEQGISVAFVSNSVDVDDAGIIEITPPIKALQVEHRDLMLARGKRYRITVDSSAVDTTSYQYTDPPWRPLPVDVDTCEGTETVLLTFTHTRSGSEYMPTIEVTEDEAQDGEDPCESPTLTATATGRPQPHESMEATPDDHDENCPNERPDDTCGPCGPVIRQLSSDTGDIWICDGGSDAELAHCDGLDYKISGYTDWSWHCTEYTIPPPPKPW
jgi:hypothetical protein